MAKRNKYSSELDALSAVLAALDPLEADEREFVYRTAGEKLGITQPSHRDDGAVDEIKRRGFGGDLRSQTAKQFMREKKPSSDIERIACLAF